MSAIWFVVIPILAYIPMFLVEAYISLRRIGKPLDKGGEYLHATWESTHTLLILGINYFMWLYSSAIVDVANSVFIPLISFGAAFIIRAILYLYLFYIKKPTKPYLLVDWIFAICHMVMLICITWIAIATIDILRNSNYKSNDILLPLLYPGLALTIPLISAPIYFLYKTRARD